VQEHCRQCDERHGEEEVHHHEVGIELEEDDQSAHDDLGDDAEHLSRCEEHEVATPWFTPQGAKERDRAQHRHRDREAPVHELDHRVVVERSRQAMLVARRPVRAAEAGASQPYGATCHDDEREGGKRRLRHAPESGGSHAEGQHCRLIVGLASPRWPGTGRQETRQPRGAADNLVSNLEPSRRRL
jgi:hypothetical protein